MKPETLERLRLHLLGFGGDPDAGFCGIQRPSIVVGEWSESEAQRLLACRPLTPSKVVLRAMRERDCHSNSEELAAELGEPAQHFWGFALSDGIWRTHSWVMDGEGGIIETTTPRDLYLGMPGGTGYYVLRFLHGPGSLHHGRFGFRQSWDDAAALRAEVVATAPSSEAASAACQAMGEEGWDPHGTPCVADALDAGACITCNSPDIGDCWLMRFGFGRGA